MFKICSNLKFLNIDNFRISKKLFKSKIQKNIKTLRVKKAVFFH